MICRDGTNEVNRPLAKHSMRSIVVPVLSSLRRERAARIRRSAHQLGRRLFLAHFACVSALASQKYPSPPPEFFQVNQMTQTPVITPGDVLTLKFHYNPELNKTVKVRPDGKISLDLFQGVSVAGLTPEDLQKKLSEMYSHEFTSPAITVDVESTLSSSVYVTGEVATPGVKEWHGNLTVAMVLAMSQVSQRTAGVRSVFLIRNVNGGKFLAYKLDASYPAGQSRDVQILPGDVLFVPRKLIVKADDFMEQYVRQLLPGTPSLSTTVLFTPGNPVTAVTH